MADIRRIAFESALSMYANEPCRICGRILTMDDIKDGAKFAGYSDDNTSRVAHRRCWEGFVDVARQAYKRNLLGNILNEDRE